MRNRVVLIVISVLMFAAAIAITVYFFWANGYMKPATESSPTTSYEAFTYPSITELTIDPTRETDIEEPYISPINFDELNAANPDIIGWIYMENPQISLPILRSPTDDTQYLYHDAEGNYNREGALFVEHQYNSADFSDPVTIIYGHRMSNGSMFGTLQATTQEETFFETPQYIVIYTPTEQKTYRIFAITSVDSQHLLINNDFTDPEQFDAFIDTVYSNNSIGYTHLDDLRPTSDDHIIILSSCLWGDRSSRFLVLAVEI